MEIHEEVEPLSTVHFAKTTPPAARDNSETLLPDVTQWLTRSQTAEGEIIKGGVRIEFADGQRDATVHISFCPPFSNTPKISAENLDSENLEIHVAASFPFGVWLILHPAPVVLMASFIAAALIVYKHKANMDRLRSGTENVFTFGRRP